MSNRKERRETWNAIVRPPSTVGKSGLVVSNEAEYLRHTIQQKQKLSESSFTNNITTEVVRNLTKRQKLYLLWGKCMISPTLAQKRMWDFFTAFFVLYNFWFIPFSISFDWWIPSSSIASFNSFLEAWFAVDMLLNFVTGYQEYGFLILSPKKIALRYLTSWFAVDLVAAIPISLFLKTSTDVPERKTIKLLKYGKLPKLLRLSHLLRQHRQYQKYTSVTTAICGIAFLAHLCSALWVAVVNPCRDLENPVCGQNNISNMYWMSINYALSILLNTGNGALYGQETVFAARYHGDTILNSVLIVHTLIAIMGILAIAIMFANVVFVVQSWRRAGNAFRKKMDIVTHEMDYLHLPQRLRAQIKGYYDYLWFNNKVLSDNLLLLNDPGMSKSLKQEISQHMYETINYGILVTDCNRYKGLLSNIPLFKDCNNAVLRELCASLRTIVYMPGDVILHKGDDPDDVYMIFRGTIEVMGCQDGNGNGPAIFLSNGALFGELAVLLQISRSRTIQACEVTELCLLSKSVFESLIYKHEDFASTLFDIIVTRYTEMQRSSDITSEEAKRRTDAYKITIQTSIARVRGVQFLHEKYSAKHTSSTTSIPTAPVQGIPKRSSIRRSSKIRPSEFQPPASSDMDILVNNNLSQVVDATSDVNNPMAPSR